MSAKELAQCVVGRQVGVQTPTAEGKISTITGGHAVEVIDSNPPVVVIEFSNGAHVLVPVAAPLMLYVHPAK